MSRVLSKSDVMDELPRQKLCELIATYGRSLCDDPRRCEGLLRDYCGASKREVHVLVSALKERVAVDLLGSPGGVPREVLFARLTTRLRDNLGLAEDAARWAVESWALALGLMTNGQRDTTPHAPDTARKATRERKRHPKKAAAPPLNADEQSTEPGPRPLDIRVLDTRASSGWSDTVETTVFPTPVIPAKSGRGWLIFAAIVLFVILTIYYSNQESSRDTSQPVLQRQEEPVQPRSDPSGVPPPPRLGPWQPSNQ